MELRDSNIEMSRVINNPLTDLIVNQLGRDESLYRLGRVDDADHWQILGGDLGLGTVRVKVTLTINKTMKATQVAKNTIGDLYFAMLDHSGSRGPGFMFIPAESSEGRVRFGAIEFTRASIDEQPEAYRNVAITEVMIKKSLDWIHDCLYYLTSEYEWDQRLTRKALSRSSPWYICSKCGGSNSVLKIQISTFFSQREPCCFWRYWTQAQLETLQCVEGRLGCTKK